MASGDAWNAGWNLGAQFAQERYAQKAGRANEAWEDKRNEFKNHLVNLTSRYQDLLDQDGKDTPASLRVKYALSQMQLAKDDFEHPPKGPGAMERIERLLHLAKTAQAPSVSTQPAALQAPPGADSMTLSATPSYQQVDKNGSQFTAHTVPGTPETTLPGLKETAPELPAEKPLTVKGPALTPRELKDRLVAHQRAQTETGQMLAGAPASPKEQAIQAAEAKAAGGRAALIAGMKLFDEENPDATPQQRQDFQNELFRSYSGVADKPAWKLYASPDGLNKQWLDASRPDLIPPGWTATATENADTRKRADYAAYVRAHPEYEKKGGNFEKWTSEAKTPTSKFGLNVDSYRKLYNIPQGEALTPSDLNFIEQQIALSSAAPSSTVTNTLKLDYRGFFVPVQETNRRVPGFGYILPPPRGDAPAESGSEGNAAPSATPGAVRTAAQNRIVAPRPIAAGTSVGRELFAGGNKQYNDTKTAYDAAVDRTKTMDTNLTNALKGDQQAMLSLVANHIGMTLGAQKGARINQAVWNEAVESAPWLARTAARFDSRGLLSGVTLAPEQMKQMVQLAHEKMDVLKEDLDRIKQELNTPSPNRPGTNPVPSAAQKKPKHYVGEKVKLKNGQMLTISVVHPDGSFE